MGEIKTVPAVIYIPENTARIKVIATLLNPDDSTNTAEMVLELPEVIDSRIHGDYWFEDNCRYVVTEKGLREAGLDKDE